jgi:dTDP-4-dehydrorhamnose reductase
VDLTIRTSIIGPELKKNGEGLFHWFMNQTGEINGFTKAFWGGITTLELVKVAHASIQQNISGIVNITNGAKICKYDLLNLFKEIYKKEDVILNSIEGKSVDKSLVSIREDFKYEVPSYRKMIEEQFEYMDVNRDLYSSIYTY